MHGELKDLVLEAAAEISRWLSRGGPVENGKSSRS
jgi:hypothetical protein